MNPVTTGDPTIDGLLAWFTGGGKLQSTGAILALGSVIKLVLVPIIAKICGKYEINFSGPNKLHAVMGCGFVMAVGINLATKQHLTLGDSLLVGMQAGIAAIGIHEASSTLKDASQAQKDVTRGASILKDQQA